MSSTSAIFKRPFYVFNRIESKIRTLNKRLAKRGAKQIELDVISVKERTLYYCSNGGWTSDMNHPFNTGRTCDIPYVTFTMSSGLEKIGEHTFAGVVDHKAGVVLAMDGFNLEPVRHETQCKHCATFRRRNKTIVLRNDVTGKLIVVGTSCVIDYIGAEAATLVAWADLSDLLSREPEDEVEEHACGKMQHNYDIQRLAALSFIMIYRDGFVKASENCSTVNEVLQIMDGSKYAAEVDAADIESIAPTVTTFIEHYSKISDKDSTFNINVRNLIIAGKCAAKYASFICAAVYGYIKAQIERESKRKEQDFKARVYEVGTPIKGIEAVLTAHNSFESGFGIKNVYTFMSEDATFVWFTSSTNVSVSIGEKVTFTGGKVKRTGEFRGQPQNVVKRVKI